MPRFEWSCLVAWVAMAWFVLAGAVRAQDEGAGSERPAYAPKVEESSNEAELAVAGFRVPAGMKVSVFAAEPLLANPVAFALDARGRAYVVETFRHSDGVTDTRGHMNWLDDDLASRTVEDRVRMYQKHLSPEEFARYGVEQERIRLVEDRDGDGVAETSTVFADGFGGAETGLAAGVLPWRGDVYFTCIPNLWKLRDTNGDGAADERTVLSSGYGVHVQFIGHDLHGPIVGPDGRLYFTMGDRGFNATTIDGQRLSEPDTGSVLRCELDGTNLEVVHRGLRNPQELAFDEHGNLFTVDNNSDGGDRARLVWVVPGGESGWQVGWQFIEQPNARGPWNSEDMWKPQNDAQPAFLVPALANLSDGPSGLAYNPGTGLGTAQRGRFFLADFRGASATSGVRSFAVRPKGAAFELVDQAEFLWGLEATDVAFGADGALYVSDWVEGWNKTGKGRIYRLSDPEHGDPAAVAEVQSLLVEGMAERSPNELHELLDHVDLRVRLEAQFELVRRAAQAIDERRDPESIVELIFSTARGEVVEKRPGEGGPSPRAIRHAVWAAGQLVRAHPEQAGRLARLLASAHSEARAQAARVAADVVGSIPAPREVPQLVENLIGLLSDENAQVRFHAACALGLAGDARALEPLVAMLAENDDRDAYLRHAGVMGLAGVADAAALLRVANGNSRPVRRAALLALRRQGAREVAQFLGDDDPSIVLEAARAIYDVPIEAALDRLSAVALGEKPSTALVRRVLAANEREGGTGGAERLAALATRGDLDSGLRAEALDALANWRAPAGRDRVTGLWRPIGPRDAQPAVAAVEGVLAGLLNESPGRVMVAAARAAGGLGIEQAVPALRELAAATRGKTTEARQAALEALERLKAPGLVELAGRLVDDSDEAMRATALDLLGRYEPAQALPLLVKVAENGTLRERQRALETLGSLEASEADAVLAAWVDRLLDGSAEPAVRLDVLEAARKRAGAEVAGRLARYEDGLAKDDPLARYRVALLGGDARAGGRVFREKAEVYCLRCHKVRGEGGEVGPELTGLGQKKEREYLLESIVMPSKQIAEGFETRVLALADGTVLTGVVKNESDDTLTLITPEAVVMQVAKDQVEEQRGGDSAMPADLVEKLTLRELRDLIEFLATVR